MTAFRALFAVIVPPCGPMTAPGEIKFTTRNNVALKILGSKSAEEYKHLALYQLLTGQPRHGLIMVKAQGVAPEVVLDVGIVL